VILPVSLSGAHEGDWEHITVRVSNWADLPNSKVEAVYFAAHGGEGKWLMKQNPTSKPERGHFTLWDGIKPMTFSAWHSHADYECPGLQYRWVAADVFANDYCSGGEAWLSSVELVSVDKILCPDFVDAVWLLFDGDFGTSEHSPEGPSQQRSWKDDGNNGYYQELETMATFGSSWGDSRECSAVAFGRIGGEDCIGVARSQGDNDRFEIYRWGDGLEFFASGGGDWGDKRGATSIAFGILNGQEVVAVGRSAGEDSKNSRFDIYSWADSGLSLMASGGEKWGEKRSATSIAFGPLGGNVVVGVARNHGSGDRFEIYGWAEGLDTLELLTSGGGDWGEKRDATSIAFGILNGQEVVAVGRSAGEDSKNSRFGIYSWDGSSLNLMASGGEQWGGNRSATAIAIGVLGEYRVVGVGRSAGENSRFEIYQWGKNGLELLVTGGEDWGHERGATGIAFGMVNGEGVVCVSRTGGENDEVFCYKLIDDKLAVWATAGVHWGDNRGATSVAFGKLNGEFVVGYGRTAGSNDRGAILKWGV
jgi:Vacuolar protein sorting-associated protein 62